VKDGAMKKFLFLLTVLTVAVTAAAQPDAGANPAVQGTQPEIFRKLSSPQDSSLVKLVELHIQRNERNQKISGYRVEIFFSSGLDARQKALQTKSAFLRDYPDMNVYILYVSPDFKVRVGDFRTKNEALRLMKQVQDRYPKAFIVPDNIEFPNLN